MKKEPSPLMTVPVLILALLSVLLGLLPGEILDYLLQIAGKVL